MNFVGAMQDDATGQRKPNNTIWREENHWQWLLLKPLLFSAPICAKFYFQNQSCEDDTEEWDTLDDWFC